MKQTKQAPKTAAPKAAPQPVAEAAASNGAAVAVVPALTSGEKFIPIVFLVLMFGSMIILTGNMSLLVVGVTLVFTLLNWKTALSTVREHVCLPVFGFIALFVMYCLAGSYSAFSESAIREMYRGMVALSLAGFALLTFRKKHVPLLLWGFSVICGIFGFLAVDGASAKVIYKPFIVLADFLADTQTYTPMQTFVDQRLSTLFNNSNVGASLLALGMFIGLYQLRTLENKKQRLAAAFLLGINAVAFFLCLSRGGMLAFGIALLVWLCLTPKGQRIRFFLLMLVSAAVTMAFSVVILPFLGTPSILPVLLILFCGIVILLVDQLLCDRLAAGLNAHMKATVVSGVVLVALAVTYIVAAVSVTGPYRLSANERMWRKLDLAPGTYTYEADMDEGVTFNIRIVEEEYLRMDTKVEVCDTAAGDTSFVIPENAAKVQISFTSETGGEIRSVSFSDGTEVKLDYSLMPRSLANRLQDSILKSTSFLQRVQYLIDALKIWVTSPIIGRGLGSSENLFSSVQPYYYASLFVHNHVLQYLSDMGLLGLGAFLMVMGGVLWLLIRRLRRGFDELAAMLVVAWVMMNVHGLMEISFSLRPYLVASMVLLAIAVIQFGDEALVAKKKDSLKRLGTTAAVCFWTALVVFGGLVSTYRLVHRSANEFSTTNQDVFLKRIETYIALDIYDDDYYKQAYVTQGIGHPEYHYKAEKFAQQLRDMKTYSNSSVLAINYYLPLGQLTEAFACSREAIAQVASMNEGWNYELENYRDMILPAITAEWMNEYLSGIAEYYNYLVTHNNGRIDPVELTEENQLFLDTAIALRKANVNAEEAYAQLMTFVKE